MKSLKILIASICLTVFDSIIGMVCCGYFFNWVYKLEPVNVWKPMDSSPSPLFFLGSFILTVLFVIIYVILQKGIPGKNKFIKGAIYGCIVTALGILPGMLATYFFMTVNTTVVIYWTIMAVIDNPIKGIITALICTDK